MAFKRNRNTYLILIVSTIALGLIFRQNALTSFVSPNVGDALYALMFFFIIGFAFPRLNSLKVLLVSLSLCYLIELSQLYQADWLNNIRGTRIGGLILGYGFLWSDMLSYTVGVLIGFFIERIKLR